MTKRIFILGHMGTGKFIFTEALAKKLGWQLVDANPSIERYVGRLTRDILGEQGEAAFNRCQADIISHCIGKENVVVLLEECVVSSEQCRKLLSSEFVVYLKVSIPTQLERMKNGREPSLPVDDMKSFLEKQHQERDHFYEEVATLVVESIGYSEQVSEINKIIEKDVNKVMKAIGK
ncbi:shikimate kinase [Legionella hackeliae]|uniref:Shikimate kinase n=1 Tax=Legionella hackeliae TaxID=449 RepID=A0A0A8UXC9_LEGHA|nr:shikimate kinase [Legionella hackeliae]KTD12735.1 shikimate kinase [Legionella hackeliae]CEK12156.1 putative shikimate kinase I [Legionella hackeliae]STX48943.1 shikimate kinase [Legionella hackeliae]